MKSNNLIQAQNENALLFIDTKQKESGSRYVTNSRVHMVLVYNAF